MDRVLSDEYEISVILKSLSLESDSERCLTHILHISAISESFRGRLFLWISGAIPTLLEKIRFISSPLGDQKNLPKTSFLLLNSMLRVLTSLCMDDECSRQLVLLGGFETILALSTQAETTYENEIACADDFLLEYISKLSDCLAQIRCGNISMSLRDVSISPEGDQPNFPIKYDFLPHASSSGVSLLIRSISRRQCSQYDVGFVLWPAAILLARWLHLKELEELRDKSVLEVGAGLGLCGILAACHARSVDISDYNPTVLKNITYNININIKNPANKSQTAIDTGLVRAIHMDWDLIPEISNNEVSASEATSYDCIIGTDMICQDSDAKNVVSLLLHYLAPYGVAHFVLPHPCTRYGVEQFPQELDRAGLIYERYDIESKLLDGIDESAYLKWHRYRVTRQI